MLKRWLWRPASQSVALRNARHASAVLAQRRLERGAVEVGRAEAAERTGEQPHELVPPARVVDDVEQRGDVLHPRSRQ